MDENNDKRIVVMDREQFDKLRSFAYHGAHDDGMADKFEAVLRHVHKFNPLVPDENDGEALRTLQQRQREAQERRRYANWIYGDAVYIRGTTRPHWSPNYLIPACIVSQGHALDGGNFTLVVEIQASDDYQREAFLSLMRRCATRGDAGRLPRYGYQLFTGHPVVGGTGITIRGRWSQRQYALDQERQRQGELFKGLHSAMAKLYLTVDVTDLTATLPDGYKACSGLFKGFYFQPTN